MKKKYLVTMIEETEYEIEIEAYNEKEAALNATMMFVRNPNSKDIKWVDGDHRIDSVEEINETE